MTDKIANDKVVGVHYTLTNNEGEVLDSSRDSDPLYYLHGAGNIVPGLEKKLAGLPIGATKKVVVAPKDGYGEKSGLPDQPIPRDAFPKGAQIQVGMSFLTRDEGGQPMPVWVTEVTESTVNVTLDHPLAGVTLNFDVEVMSLRAANDSEKEHGHAHGADGHSHHHHH